MLNRVWVIEVKEVFECYNRNKILDKFSEIVIGMLIIIMLIIRINNSVMVMVYFFLFWVLGIIVLFVFESFVFSVFKFFFVLCLVIMWFSLLVMIC